MAAIAVLSQINKSGSESRRPCIAADRIHLSEAQKRKDGLPDVVITKSDGSITNGQLRLRLNARRALVDHPLFRRCKIDPLVFDGLVLRGDAKDFKRLAGGTFKPILKPARDQDSFAFRELADQLVALAVEFHSAVHHIPEGIIAGVGMEIVFAAVLHDLDHDFHEIAIAYNHRLLDALEFGS